MIEILKVPYLGTAEDDVLVAEWFVQEGESFRKGQIVAAVETLKAAFEVEAEADGVLLRRLVEEGARAALQAPLALFAAPGVEVDDAAIDAAAAEVAAAADGQAEAPAEPASSDGGAPAAPAQTGGDAPAAPAARRLARERGIDLGQVRGTGPAGLIRVEDVEAFSPAASALADGTLDPAFLAHLRADRAAFAALGSDFKVALYRRHGALLGDGAHLAPGAVLLVDKLVLGAGAYFGPNTTVEAAELHAGDLLHFGRDCRVRCTKIECGDNAFFTDDIEIGGGGAMEPEAELVVGSHGFVGEHVHLNPCRRLELGDEVVVSRNAVVMTHSFGGSILKGYPNRFAGVRVGSYAQIGIQATLFPGVEMGEGSILLSGSSLVSSVPPGRLYGGVPAKDLKGAHDSLDAENFARIAADLVAEFARQLGLRGFEVSDGADGADATVAVKHKGQVHVLRLVLGDAVPAALSAAVAEEVHVYAACGDAAWDAAPDVVIDLGGGGSVPRIRGSQGPLADAFREFLRKRGVRLEPRTWAYKGGWL